MEQVFAGFIGGYIGMYISGSWIVAIIFGIGAGLIVSKISSVKEDA